MGGCVEEDTEGLVRGDGDFGSGDAFDAMELVGDAPVLDHPEEGVVGDEVEGREGLAGDGAGGVAGVEPGFDARAVVGDACGSCDRVFDQVQGDGAAEVVRDWQVGGGQLWFWF